MNHDALNYFLRSLNRLATVSLCPNPKIVCVRVRVRMSVCVCVCHVVVWGLLSPPRGLLALSLSLSLPLSQSTRTR